MKEFIEFDLIYYVIREIGFEFRDTLAPVGGRFLRNQLNIEERSLARPVNVSRSGSSHNARRHVRDNVLIKHPRISPSPVELIVD